MTLNSGTAFVVILLLLIVPLFAKNFVIFQMTQLLYYGLAVLALNILTGGSGQFSLGQSAFYAIGAYTTGILMEQYDVNYALTLPIAGIICFGAGFLFGQPALRLSGVYLALATFALATAMPQLLKLGFFEPWTGGVQGLVVTKPDAPFGLPMGQDMWLYYFTLAITIAIYVFSVNLLRSRSGRAFMAIRDNEIAASAMGVDVALYKTLAFGVSAAITGIAGSLGAIAVQFVAPESYTITLAISLFLGMVVGGVGWLPGSIVGAAFIIFVPNMAEGISKGLSGAVFGVLLFLVIFLVPNGSKQVADLGRRLVSNPGAKRPQKRTSEEMSDLTSQLARHVCAYRNAKLDDRALTVAKQCVLDWYGVLLAGMREPVSEILRTEIAPTSLGSASIVGTELHCAPADAALINGATAHALDYDDVHPLIGHPTAAIFPAALAIGEAQGRSYSEVLRAFIAGYEAAAFVGSLVMRSHYDRGFHSTGTLGSFGAAAAAGLLMDLDETQMTVALGLAGTQAAGLKSMFGTMAKPFHAGRAASNGVLAAQLAARGFTAGMDVLESNQGFVVSQSDGKPERGGDLPEFGSIIVDNLFKYHAACYLTHSSIEAVKSLRDQLSIDGKDMAAIEVHVAAGHLTVCNIVEPKSGLQTKFSLRHTAALAACGKDTAAVPTYSDENAVDPSLVAIRNRVTVHGDRAPGQDAHVAITTTGGQRAEATVDVGNPVRDLTLQERRLSEKFNSLAVAAIGSERANSLRGRVLAVETTPSLGALAV
jgi:branched-chain amino acid transport system permease protein